MKYVRQFLIILFFSFIGELLKFLIPLPIPASIYGLVLMFLTLQFKVLKIDSVKETAKFLVEIMPVMFIPAGVELLTSWSSLQQILIPIVVITIISTVVVMAVAGKVTDSMLQLKKKKKERGAEE
ncbi:MAG: CidA/LrgA family protein [Clostridiales bacterium]|nr:CidA/LrgA family protein [Clostridiales bacterium]